MTTGGKVQVPPAAPTAHRDYLPRDLGPVSIGVLALAGGAVWLAVHPAGGSVATVAGQWLGYEAVLLMSAGLVLISSLPWVERWFDGIDRAAVWHRRVMITGIVLLLLHIGLATNPHPSSAGPALGAVGLVGLLILIGWAIAPRWRSVIPRLLRRPIAAARKTRPMRALGRLLGGYERWRVVHRATGLFLAAGFAHGLMDSTTFGSPVLRWSYVAIGAVGLGFYTYRELLARRFAALHDYQVDAVTPVGAGLTELRLRPLGRHLDFVPGQFALLYVEGKDGWHRHPFTIANAPRDPVVRVTIKALGDFTSALPGVIEPGMPAVLGAAHGHFDHRRGTGTQLWIAAGVGVAPFLSWLRAAAPGQLAPSVDFFYSTAGPAPFASELEGLAARHSGLRLHLIDSTADGRLTAGEALTAAGAGPRQLSVFMCGPSRMLAAFDREFRAAGVPRRNIHREYFDLR
jgi:predicted ferric reductase